MAESGVTVVGSELSTNNYGGQEWWLLLEPMAT